MGSMIKVLEDAVERVKVLSPDRQRYAAEVLDRIAEAGDAMYALSDEERAAVREGLADLDAGRIVSDAEMDAFWKRNRG